MKHVTRHILFNVENKEVYMTVCPKCKRENDVTHVPHGVCAWCGFDARKMVDSNGNLIN